MAYCIVTFLRRLANLGTILLLMNFLPIGCSQAMRLDPKLFSNRTLSVVLDSYCYAFHKINSGVPQGLLFALILFFALYK